MPLQVVSQNTPRPLCPGSHLPNLLHPPRVKQLAQAICVPCPRPATGKVSTLAYTSSSAGDKVLPGAAHASSGIPGAGPVATHLASSGGAAGVEVSRGSQAGGQAAGTQDNTACWSLLEERPDWTSHRPRAWQDPRAPPSPLAKWWTDDRCKVNMLPTSHVSQTAD